MKGKVNRADLIAECNKIIKLEASEKDKLIINQEENKLLNEVSKEFEQISNEN